MAKQFARRVSKKERKQVDLSDKISRDLLKWGDEKLLEGVTLNEVRLADIHVKEQVRTKFNDSSLKDLSENIRVNGLIQPLVVHKNSQGGYTLVCGERRFRAMSLIKKPTAPCFILEDKSEEQLMAIQFSENSAREELHYIDKADGIFNYHKATKASERKIVKALGISKSEVHRSLLIARLPKKLKEATKQFNTEKYVLLELDELPKSTMKKDLEKQVLSGDIIKRAQLKKAIKAIGGIVKPKTTRKKAKSDEASVKALLAAMDSEGKLKKLDKKTRELLKSLTE